MEKNRILKVVDMGKLVVCYDSSPMAIGETVEECKEWVFQNDPHCDPNRWVQVPQRNSVTPEKWININTFGLLWSIYRVPEIV